MTLTEENPIHILLADDDSDDSFLFNEALEQSNIVVKFTLAENGNELINLLENEVRPDILFLDINMPFKNGIECLSEIRSKSEFKAMPIIIYSTTNYKVNIDACYEGGANLYVVKPNSFDDILKMINKVCTHDWYKKNERPAPENFIFTTFG